MTSLVSSLIHNLPVIGNYMDNKKDKEATRINTTDLVDLNRLATSVVNDRIQSTSSGYDTPIPYNSHHEQRNNYKEFFDKLIQVNYFSQQQEELVNRQSIMQGIKLIGIAVDEFDSGNECIALDIYLSGLDKIIMSLPNLDDGKTKNALKDKLISLEDRVGIAQKVLEKNNEKLSTTTATSNLSAENLLNKVAIISNILTPTWLTTTLHNKLEEVHHKRQDNTDSLTKFKHINKIITDIIVQFVILFKQSPLPDLIGLLYLLLTYFIQLLSLLEQHFQIIKKAQQFGIICIKKLLAADEKYHLHEFASEALYTFVSATLKAIVAYKETPGFMEQRNEQQQNEQQKVSKPTWIWSRSTVNM